MSNYIQSYLEEIESIQKQITEFRENVNLINERVSWIPEHQKIPLDLIKNKNETEAKLVELRGILSQRLETVAGLSDLSKALSRAPYRLNRIEQRLTLSQALKELDQRSDRPLICLVHGDKYQSQDMFIEYLGEVFLPKLLKEPGTVIYPLQFPESLKSFHDQLQYELSRTVLKDELTESNELINNFLAQSPVPVIIYAYVYCDQWLKRSCEAIKKFLIFWENWPALMTNQRLFVFLLIIDNCKQKHGGFRGFPLIFLDDINTKLNKEIKRLLGAFSSSNFSQFDNFRGLVLPELKGITEQQAVEWVDIMGRTHFPDNLAFIKDVKLEIQAIFSQCKTKDLPKRIPMDELARQLSGILFDYAAILHDYATRRELA